MINDFTQLIGTPIEERPHGENCNNLSTCCWKCWNDFLEYKKKQKLEQ